MTAKDGGENEGAYARVLVLVEAIKIILAGQPREIVGGVLADLTSIWLAAHFADGPKATAEMREEQLKLHVAAVRELIEPNEAIILRQHRARETQQ